MIIPETTHYVNITAPLRAPALSKNVVFGAEGFSYNSNTLCVYMKRINKNRYIIDAIYCAKKETYEFGGSGAAVEFAVKLVEFDRTGALSALR